MFEELYSEVKHHEFSKTLIEKHAIRYFRSGVQTNALASLYGKALKETRQLIRQQRDKEAKEALKDVRPRLSVRAPLPRQSLEVGRRHEVKLDVSDYKQVNYAWLELTNTKDTDRYLSGTAGSEKTSYNLSKRVVLLQRRGTMGRVQTFTGILVMQEVPPGGTATFKACIPKDNSPLSGKGPPYGKNKAITRAISHLVTKK